MSFILDALKKSERERTRQQGPTALELPQGKRRRATPLWMIGVLLLLLVNCVLLFMMWLRDDPVAPAATATNAAASSAAAMPAIRPAARPIRSLEEEAGLPPPVGDPEPEETSAPPPVENGATPLVRAIPETETVAPVTSEPASAAMRRVTVGMPTLESLGGHTALNLPDIRLDLHVFAPDPTKRFVFINGKRYAEGAMLAEGPTVENITDEGVVLSSRGRKFLLPR